MLAGDCIYCGQRCVRAADGAWEEIEDGTSGCGDAVDLGRPAGEHEVSDPYEEA